MHYNNYPPSAHQGHPAIHSSQSTEEYASAYPDPSHHHSTMSYAAVTPATHMSAGPIAHQNPPTQYTCPTYTVQGSADEHRSYYATSSQGPPVDHCSSPGSPAGLYATPNPSGHISTSTSRHPTHPPHQQQQQFIPTPSQAYQVYSTAGPTTSSARSRSTVEPYYHMSPNPQHVVHAPPATTHGTGSRSTAHGSGSSHSHHAHNSTHTSTIVVAASERYACDLCDRSFTRLHDRRRHYETVHATSPVLHKCRYCRKDFSRADSLKRHVDNGCDEMPR